MLHPDNPYVLGPQLAAAAQELPITEADREFFGDADRPWRPAGPPRGAAPSARGLVLDRARAGGRRDGPPDERRRGPHHRELDRPRARARRRRRRRSGVHPGAVYLHLGESYLAEALDLEAGEAMVRPARPGYLTQPQSESPRSRPHVEAAERRRRMRSTSGESRSGRGSPAICAATRMSGQIWDADAARPARTGAADRGGLVDARRRAAAGSGSTRRRSASRSARRRARVPRAARRVRAVRPYSTSARCPGGPR